MGIAVAQGQGGNGDADPRSHFDVSHPQFEGRVEKVKTTGVANLSADVGNLAIAYD
jgi:hypothetical protein